MQKIQRKLGSAQKSIKQQLEHEQRQVLAQLHTIDHQHTHISRLASSYTIPGHLATALPVQTAILHAKAKELEEELRQAEEADKEAQIKLQRLQVPSLFSARSVMRAELVYLSSLIRRKKQRQQLST